MKSLFQYHFFLSGVFLSESKPQNSTKKLKTKAEKNAKSQKDKTDSQSNSFPHYFQIRRENLHSTHQDSALKLKVYKGQMSSFYGHHF